MNVSAVPPELQERHQWAGWKTEDRDSKPTKVPYRADGAGRASSTDPTTWATFHEALAAVEPFSFDGIGYMFAADDPYTGLDFDDCLEGDDLHPEVAALLLAFNSYTEVSPSGRGVKTIVRASKNGTRACRTSKTPWGGRFECYDTERFFTITGALLRGMPGTVEDRQAELDEVLARFLPKREPVRDTSRIEPAPVHLDDQQLADFIRAKFPDLWAGRWEYQYGSQSEADLALCDHLAWVTGNDAPRIDRLFRTSGLYRNKWEKRPEYRETTINAAIGGTNGPLTRNVGPALDPSQTSLSEIREVPSDIPDEWGLAAILEAFAELLVMPDPGAVEVALAGIVANYAPGDAVNPLLVGPPGCGKSEIVSSLRKAPAVWPLSSLTPQTLLSGFERKGKDKGPPASMLLQIGEFGILAFKDLTTVLTMHREARAQIISQLREVADGRTEKNFGNGLRLEWEGKLGFVAGVTPVIDEQHAFLSVMGERFVLYRMPEVSRPEIARRSLARRGREEELRTRITTLVAEFLAQFRNVDYLELPDRFTEPLIALADIVTRSRSGVARDFQTRDILYLPEPEAPTRFAKQIAQLMAAAIKIGVPEERAWWLARKVGWDSVPAVRSAVIHLLAWQEGVSLTYAELEKRTGLPATTVRRVVEDLVVLGLADRRKDGDASNARWLLTESRLAREYWDTGESAS